MDIKIHKVLRISSKIVLVLSLLILLGVGGYLIQNSLQNKPYKVRVTNVTDSAFTVSWITDEPMVGIVYYGEDENFFPGPFASIGKKKAVDDRDYSNAQTECISEFSNKASKTKDANFTVDITNYDCEDITVNKYGKYYTHHITVGDLEPNKQYFFRVGNEIMTFDKNNGVYTENELPGVETFAVKTEETFTEIGTPSPAYGVTYSLYYDDETLMKKVSFDSLMFLLAKKDDVVLASFSGVANSDGGWTIDMGNIRDEQGAVILEKEGIELEFIPQAENFLPANRKIVFFGDVEFPLSMVGNNHDTWENPRDVKQGNVPSEKSILGIFKHDSFAVDMIAQSGGSCPSGQMWLWRSSKNSCVCASTDNGYATKSACEQKGADNDKDEIIVGEKTRDCNDEDGCVCLFDRQGDDYMTRIDVKFGQKCSPKTVCQGKDRWSGKLDIQMGQMCIDPSGCECFNGGTYAGVNAQCGCKCGGECGEVPDDNDNEYDDNGDDDGKDDDGKDDDEEEFSDVIPIGVLCKNSKGCTCVANEGSTIPVGHVDKGLRCSVSEEEYTSLEEVCGKYSKPAQVRYTKHEGTGKNVLVCLGNDEYKQYEDRCKDGMGALTFASPDFYLIEESGDGKYKLGKKEHFIGRLYCPEVHFSLAIEVDGDQKIKPQVEKYAKYKCCVKEGAEGTGTLGYSYSFEEDCAHAVGAEKCNIDMKSTFCISEEEPNLLFAVLYPRSHDDKYDNDKSICEEEKGEGLRGGFGGYANETAHYGKNCCEEEKKEYEVNNCIGSPKVKWNNCINNGKIGKVYDKNPIRFNELRLGGGNLYKLPDKFVKSISAQEESVGLSEDEEIESVFYFPESGVYEIATLDGQTRNVFGDKNTSYFYFKNRDGVPGYQAPVNPEVPEDDEDLIIPRVVAEVSVSRSTTAKEMELKEGVNVISFDFLPSGGKDTLEKLTSSNFLKIVNLSGNNISRISYFTGGQWQGGIIYDFKTGETSGTSFELSFGKGYVVVAERDVTISIPGYNIESSVPIAFSSGWNLIGVHGHDTQYTANSFINSINSIEGLKSNNVTYWPTSKGMYQGYQLSEGQSYGQDFSISPNLGYFVRINEFTPKTDSCKSLIWNPGGSLNGECGTSN